MFKRPIHCSESILVGNRGKTSATTNCQNMQTIFSVHTMGCAVVSVKYDKYRQFQNPPYKSNIMCSLWSVHRLSIIFRFHSVEQNFVVVQRLEDVQFQHVSRASICSRVRFLAFSVSRGSFMNKLVSRSSVK